MVQFAFFEELSAVCMAFGLEREESERGNISYRTLAKSK